MATQFIIGREMDDGSINLFTSVSRPAKDLQHEVRFAMLPGQFKIYRLVEVPVTIERKTISIEVNDVTLP
jgi:hypothetical protein